MPPAPRHPDTLKALINAGQDGLTPDLLAQLPQPWHIAGESGEGYQISPPLLRAAQVALLLRQPLLLTGDPGVGKTRFAAALAYRLNLQLDYHRIHVKTTTSGRDLLYMFDDVARFRDAATGKADGAASAVKPLANYVKFSGLGLSIMSSAGPDQVVQPVGFTMAEVAGAEHAGKSAVTLGKLFPALYEKATGPRHSLVLIDELDKAPRDTPNDLLVEIEEMRFDIREIGVTVKSNPDHWPIVIITSNSERSFPDPFLRRCVFHHLDFPTDKLPMIIAARIPGVTADAPIVDDAVKRFLTIRDDKSLDKAPATAELIAFVALMMRWGKDPDETISLNDDEARQAAGVLAKTHRDEERIVPHLTG